MVIRALNERVATKYQVNKTKQEMDKEDTRRKRFLTQSTAAENDNNFARMCSDWQLE